jgi:D-alanyl-D-alanine carboxypeptidase/D-alanyl-D-alanine-endopeptidase (penicillin-binding protein 4)
VLFALAIACATSAPVAPAAAQSTSSLDAVVAPIDREKAIGIGVRVEDLDGELVYDYHGERELALASNNKLFTTAAALLALPQDYRWHTRAYLRDDVLRVVGGGDPSLRVIGARDVAEEYLASLAAVLQDRGIAQVAQVELDASFFGPQLRHALWPADQLHGIYCAPVSGLSLNGGCTEVRFQGGRLSTAPSLGGAVQWKGTDKKYPSLSAWLGNSDLQIHARPPKDGKTQSVSFAMRDPLQVFATWLRVGLARHGIRVMKVVVLDDDARGAAPAEEADLIHDWPSAWTLADVVVVCNKVSDNFLAETLLKTLGAELSASGSYAAGRAAVHEVFAAHGMGQLRFDQADGSGMARDPDDPVNTSTPAQLCLLLREMALREEGTLLFDSLPIGGVEGKLGSRFRDAAFQPQRVHAKTGFILGASSLSGYLLLPDDRILVFSIVVNFDRARNRNTNNRRFKKMQEQVLARLIAENP